MFVQIVGSLAVLLGFALSQWGLMNQKSLSYLLVNAIGSGLLAIDAVVEDQWGFLLLEGCWAIVSMISLVKIHVLKGTPKAQDT
jgi:hypothetical protein